MSVAPASVESDIDLLNQRSSRVRWAAGLNNTTRGFASVPVRIA